MMGKRNWILITCILLIGLTVVFGALVGGLWVRERTTVSPVLGAGLSESEADRLALEALKIEYTGTPAQMVVTQTTVGKLNKFHCGQIGAMISRFVSPLQGNPDVCAPDSGVWVVWLYGEFQHKAFTTGSVRVILDRAGRMMSLESGELSPAFGPGY